jgi:hypothetical protein
LFERVVYCTGKFGLQENREMKNAIDRGNVNADGTIWCHGQIVQATSENARLVIEDAEKAIDFHTERIAIINEHPDGVTEEILRELFGVDHRYYGWSSDRLIEMLKNRIEASMQYVVDIREAAQNYPALVQDPVVIQDDGSGNQVTASGRVLR